MFVTQDSTENKENGNKKSKAPYIFMGVIGAAILAALVYLVLSLTGVGSPKAAVQKAFLNTWSDLTQKNDYVKALKEARKQEQMTEEILLNMTDFSLTEYGETVVLPDFCRPVRFRLTSTTNRSGEEMYLDMAAGLGDRQDIQVEMYLDNEGYLFGLGDLYPDYFALSSEDLTMLTGVEINLEDDMDKELAQEALSSLGASLSGWAVSAYLDVECEKLEKTTIYHGDAQLQAQEYYLWMSDKNYKKHLQKLPEAIENADVFMDWLRKIMPEEAEEWTDSLNELVSEKMTDKDADCFEIGSVYVSDGKVVQLVLPLDSEKDDIVGEWKISFLGTGNVGDDIRVLLDATASEERIVLDYSGEVHGEEVQFAMNMSLDGEKSTGVSFSVNLTGSYGVRKADSMERPDETKVNQLLEMDEAKLQEVIVTVCYRMLEGKHLPEEWEDTFQFLKSGIGDIQVGEEENVSDDLPYLFCEEDDLVLEVSPLEGFTYAEEYSGFYAVEYEKMIGDGEDWLIMDYQIVLENREEFLAWQAEYWEEYYTSMGYNDVNIGAIQYGVIGGYQAAWFEYSASADSGRSMGILAFAQIDDRHGCALDFYSLYGKQAPTVDMLYESFQLYQMEY